MSDKIEISKQDWQKLVDLHEKLDPLLIKAVMLFQAVAYTATSQEMAKDAIELFTTLEPVARMIVVEDRPFGIKPTN